MERSLLTVLTLLLVCVLVLPNSAVATEQSDVTYSTVRAQTAPDVGLPDNDELFAVYAEQTLLGSEISFLGTAAGEKLSGDEKLAYDALKTVIKQIASGQRASTAVSLGYGVYNVNTENGVVTVTPETTVNFTEATDDFDLTAVVTALLSDCPYDLYWYDKTVGCETSCLQTPQLCYIEFYFCVADGYAAGIYTTDTTKTAAAATAATNAGSVVSANASLSDYDKLAAYRSYICNAVSYNDSAASNNTTPYGDPWQLIYVFDGDSSTNVVCEGYSKAFQYLCDLSSFEGDVASYSVSGQMDSENHMWNIVTLGGKNYLVDVTNSDAGTVGQDGRLFLAGGSGSVTGGYTVGGCSYTYGSNTLSLWGTGADSILTLATKQYTVPDDIIGAQDGDWTFNLVDGQCTITAYAGSDVDVVVPSKLGGYPVYKIASHTFYGNYTMQSLTFSEGIRLMGSEAIFSCSELKSIHFPSTMQLESYNGDGLISGLSSVPVECYKLQKITVAEGNPGITVYDGILYSKNMKQLLLLPPADPREVLDVPDGIIEIGDDSCRDNKNLKKVILPDTVETIGYWAFIFSSNLEEINIPKNCTFIGQYAFQYTSLKSIHIPAALTIIAPGAFGVGCRLETITVDSQNPFFYAVDNVLYQKISDGAELVKYPAGSSQTEFTVPAGTSMIGNFAFDSALDLKQVSLPKGVKTIENYAFHGCENLERITLPEGLEVIEDCAFFDCHFGLREIHIPSSVQYMGAHLFANCYNFKQIVFKGDAPSLDSDAFSNICVKAYYPADNATWTADVMQHYGGALTWVPYEKKSTGWVKADGKWYYCQDDSALQDEWLKFGGNWYYLDEDGVMATGWAKVDGKWYYFSTGGAMQTGWQKVSGKWYYLKNDMKTGWQKIDSKWYYFNTSGAMQTGWQQISGKWYYLNTSGVMQTGWVQISGKWYYLNTDMKTGWQKIDSKWYLLSDSGVMQTGWQKVSGKWYYLKNDMKTGWQKIDSKWYYFNTNGAMQTGWQKISSKWYYMNTGGVMVTGTHTIDGKKYIFNSSGVWVG